jgi:hypothetical protein
VTKLKGVFSTTPNFFFLKHFLILLILFNKNMTDVLVTLGNNLRVVKENKLIAGTDAK